MNPRFPTIRGVLMAVGVFVSTAVMIVAFAAPAEAAASLRQIFSVPAAMGAVAQGAH
jgi:hypothetical protein